MDFVVHFIQLLSITIIVWLLFLFDLRLTSEQAKKRPVVASREPLPHGCSFVILPQ